MCVREPLSFPAMFLGSRYRKYPRGNFTARSLLNLYCISPWRYMLRIVQPLISSPHCSRAHPSRILTRLSQVRSVGRMMVELFSQIFISTTLLACYVSYMYHIFYYRLYFLGDFFFFCIYLVLRKR